MHVERRLDTRHKCSQKAVLINDSGVNRLSIITNLSNGGLCVSMVGTATPMDHQNISLKVHHKTFLCHVVNSKKHEINCGFAPASNGDDIWDVMSLEHVNWQDANQSSGNFEINNNILSAACNDQYNQRTGNSTLSNHNTPNYNLCLIYTEGCFAGRGQIDPTTVDVDATIDVLNPYHIREKRMSWALGFKDAVNHAAKNYNSPRRFGAPMLQHRNLDDAGGPRFLL